MNPNIWGPKLWYSLHIMSFNYPEHPTFLDKRHYNDFFTNLQYVIPCSKCKLHYRHHLEQYPISPHLDTREYFVKWLIHLHNQVNISLNKPVKTYEEVLIDYKTNLSKYDQIQNTSKLTIYHMFKLIIMLSILIILLVILFKLIKNKKKIIYIGNRR